MTGKIYIIPSLLGEYEYTKAIPRDVLTRIYSIKDFVVENTRSARRFLIHIGHPVRPDDLNFYELDKHSPEEGMAFYVDLCMSGNDIGILSEAGMPGIADPGSLLVKEGHKNGIGIVPLTGPSSIILALAASGMNGQHFIFHGYLPVQEEARSKRIKEMEVNAAKHSQTQIFIETPYRNMQMFDSLLKNCHSSTLLCLACNINLEDEFIVTKEISSWRKNRPEIHKKPCVFLLYR